MERERIERLAVDCAADELNEDGQVLFKMYLAEHPEENRWAEDIMRIYEKTKAAIDAKTMDGGAGDEKPFIRRNRLLQLKWQRFGRSAAAVILGALIGFTAGRWEMTGKTNRITLTEPSLGTRQVKTISNLKEKYAGTFWGDKILASLEPKPYPKQTEYKSNKKFWPNFRRYIKEKHYE